MSEPVIITYLEMNSLAEFRPRPCYDDSLCIREATVRQWKLNRLLYDLIGSDWLWREKLSWTDSQWREYAEAESLRTFVGYFGGSIAGYFELQQQPEANVQIMYFGLAPQFLGRGFGAALLTRAIEEAWNWKARRVWVHTCTLDHPAALANYQARGMRIFKTSESHG
jgi:GNAT superfamily N-acetyltransferase